MKFNERTVLSEDLKHFGAIWHFVRHKKIAGLIGRMDGKRVLDMGCGIGLLDFLILDKEVVGLDVNVKAVKEAKRIARLLESKVNGTWSFIVADMHCLPLRERFDAIVVSEVLEHLEDDMQALKYTLQFLEKDGFLVIAFPNKLRLSSRQIVTLKHGKMFMHSDHIREYTVEDVCRFSRFLSLKMKHLGGSYLDFPLFRIFDGAFYAFRKIGCSTLLDILVSVYAAMYRLYESFWSMLEKLFWHHAFYIIAVLQKPPNDQVREYPNTP